MATNVPVVEASEEYVRGLHPSQQILLGVDPKVAVNFYAEKLFAEPAAQSYLPSRRALRSLFGTDEPVAPAPPFNAGPNEMYGGAYQWYDSQLQFQNSRAAVYQLVQEMGYYGFISSALDAYAEDATQFDYDQGRIFWVESDSQEIKQILMDMFDRVQLEDRAFSIARGTAQFGDHFEQLVYAEGRGVLALKYVHASRLTRIEDKYGTLLGFARGLHEEQELSDAKKEELPRSHPYEFIHFRRLGARRFGSHGESMILGARRSWMQTKIMEDSMILYRLNRAPDRLVWYVDVGTQAPNEQRTTIEYWRQAYRKRMFLNTQTGQLRQEWNPVTAEEDIFFPVPRGSNSKIDKLAGSANVGDIHDIEHMISKLAGDLRVPKAFLGFEGDLNSKSSLIAQDIRYARTVKTLQRAVRYGVTQLCRIELALHGIKDTDSKAKFTVHMSPISYLDEMQRAELLTSRLELARSMSDLATDDFNRGYWSRHILKDVLRMSDQQVARFVPNVGATPVQADLGGGLPPPPPSMGGDSDLDSGPTVPRDQALATPDLGAAALPGSDVPAPPMEGRILPHPDSIVIVEKVEGKLPDPSKLQKNCEFLYDLVTEETNYLEAVTDAPDMDVLATCKNPKCESKSVRVVRKGKTYYHVCERCSYIAEIENEFQAST